MALVFIQMPYSFIRIFRQDEFFLEENEEFKRLHGTLYAGVKVDKMSQRSYFLFFFSIRLMYLMLALGFSGIPLIFQI